MYFALESQIIGGKRCVHNLFPSWTVFGKVFERKAGKYCSILKSHCCHSEAHRVINLEMAKILKEERFNDVLPGQKLCRQCVTEYEKLTKLPENKNMTNYLDRVHKNN